MRFLACHVLCYTSVDICIHENICPGTVTANSHATPTDERASKNYAKL